MISLTVFIFTSFCKVEPGSMLHFLLLLVGGVLIIMAVVCCMQYFTNYKRNQALWDIVLYEYLKCDTLSRNHQEIHFCSYKGFCDTEVCPLDTFWTSSDVLSPVSGAGWGN